MQRIPYNAVAGAIANADDEESRRRAGKLWAAYNTMLPEPESVKRRMELLHAALKGV